MKTILTTENKAFIAENYLKMSGSDIARKIGVNPQVVNVWKRKNGLIVPQELKNQFKANGHWKPFTAKEDVFIIKHIETKNVKWIGVKLKRCNGYVSKRAKELGFDELLGKKSIESQFPKEHKSFNKGKKMEEYLSPEAITAIRKTCFKKGRTPHNAKEDGVEVLRKDSKGIQYWLIKLPTERKLVYKHIYLWEQKHGKVEKGFNVVFKDGNQLNCTLDNLECISNAELMQRNTIHRFPEELKTTIKLVSKLKRKINEKHNC